MADAEVDAAGASRTSMMAAVLRWIEDQLADAGFEQYVTAAR